MFTYTHFILASRLATYIKPTSMEDYFLGAMVPDIRYLSKIPREQTHLPLDVLIQQFAAYPEQHSFLAGYFVHCLIDDLESNLNRKLLRRFPLIIFKPFLRTRYAAVLLELYFIESTIEIGQVCGERNPVLADLGIPQQDVAQFALYTNQLIRAPSFERQIEMVTEFGIRIPARVIQYLHTYQTLKRHTTLLSLLFSSLRMRHHEAKVEAKIVSTDSFKRLLATLEGLNTAEKIDPAL